MVMKVTPRLYLAIVIVCAVIAAGAWFGFGRHTSSVTNAVNAITTTQPRLVSSVDAVTGSTLLLAGDATWSWYDPMTGGTVAGDDGFPKIPAGTHPIDVAVDAVRHAVAYTIDANGTDAVFIITPSRIQPVQLVTARHSYTGNDESMNKRIERHLSFSPNGDYLMVQTSLWEGCETYVFDAVTYQQSVKGACDAYVWSSDGTRAARITTGYGDSPNLNISNSGRPSDLAEVQWGTAKGDTSIVYDAVSKQLKVGFVAAEFVTTDQLVVLTGADSNGQLWVMEYTLSTNTLKKIASIYSNDYERMDVVGARAVIFDGSRVSVVDLTSGHVDSYLQSIVATSGSVDVSVLAKNDHQLFIMQRDFDMQFQFSRQNVIVIDVVAKEFHTIVNDTISGDPIVAGVR